MLACAQYHASRLPAGVIKMPEYSNELWNYGTYAKTHELLARMNNPADPDYARCNTPPDDQYVRTARLWALQAARMSRAWKTAFPGEFGTTLRPILAGQFGNRYWHQLMTEWLALPAQANEFGSFSQLFWAISCATYTGGSEIEMAIPTTAASFLTCMNGGTSEGTTFNYSLPKVIVNAADPYTGSLRYLKQFATSLGVKVIGYEAGLHTHDDQNAAVKYAFHTYAPTKQHVLDLVNAVAAEGWDGLFWLSGQVAKYRPTNVNSFSWPIAEGYSSGSTPKLEAMLELLTTYEGP
jgi:hypothetical protein